MAWKSQPEESAELLDLAQQAGRVGIFEWQVEVGAVRVSPQLLDLYGLVHFDNKYASWLNCVFREDQVRLTTTFETAFANASREADAEFRIVRQADNELRWMEARTFIFYGPTGRPLRVVGVNADITERKRAMVELRRFTETLEERVKERTRELEAENAGRLKAEEALRQAQKMEAVGQLTGGIAHDFNNLLTVVFGGLDMIGRQIPLLPSGFVGARNMNRGRDMAIEAAKRAAVLTSRLLAFSRRQALEPRPIDANRLVADISELLRRSIGEAVSLETVLAGGLWRIFVDTNQLENAILNLSLNARDAMPEGGKLTIETANCFLDEHYVADLPEPVASGQFVMIAVTDSGVGMDKATIDRAFEPFFTTKDMGKGTGLGLSQVYGFIRQSGGHTRIYSEPGHGTTVKIYLPRYMGDIQSDETPKPLAQEEPASGVESILVVEDDPPLRAYACEVLRDLGYQVIEAGNAVEALAILDRGATIDLMFTDVVMPGGMNGRQLRDEALRRQPDLKVLYTTGYSRNAIVHNGQLDQGVNLLGKPYSHAELAAKIRALLDHE